MKILIAGDFCPRDRVADKFEQGDYESVLTEVKDITANIDYSIVNFECPVTKGGESPIEKCGPNLHCSEKGMEAVKWAGFNCVTLANNHFLDYGSKGVEHTLEACKKYGIDTVGGGMNLQEASKILYKEIKGQTLAIINCCEHEFSIATDETAGSNPLSSIQQFYAIKEARSKADYVLVIVHGGNEYYQLPSPRMQETYRFFIDTGADAVVNHHQHCYSGYEVYNNKPIFYGLGNFCFDRLNKRDSTWNKGYMTILNFAKEISFEVVPYVQCNYEITIKMMEGSIKGDCLSKIEEFNAIICNKEELGSKYKKYTKENSDLQFLFSPYMNVFLTSLCKRRMIPSFVSRNKRTMLLAYIQCESHFPKVLNYLRS